ncbi:MAG: alpha/beta hydrolase fold domain-containing protein [Blastocatellia bacterium]|nr:alpha/beta hydrolase fold domain-containing protein [Blastocatellia bacterium]
MIKITKLLLSALIIVLLSLSAYAQKVTHDISYGDLSEPTMTADLYEPEGETSTLRPLVIFVSAGQKSEGEPYSRLFTSAGFLFACVNYKVSSLFTAPTDVLTSVRYFKANAKQWNIDPKKIALFGVSSGATVAVLAATSAETGEYESGLWSSESSQVAAASGIFATLATLDREWVEQISQNNLPILLLHKDQETVVLHSATGKTKAAKFWEAGEQLAVAFFNEHIAQTVPDITPPMVRNVTVNGGVDLTAGQTVTINWESSDNIGVIGHEILLSTDGGASFAEGITKGLAGNVRTFAWASPSTLRAENAVIAILAFDANGNRRMGSSAPFKVNAQSPDSTPPTVNNVSINNGQDLTAGESFTVTWQSSDNVAIASQDLLVSFDEGKTFPFVIVAGLASGISNFTWKVPETMVSDSVLIAVLARDPNGNQRLGVSTPFRIKAATPDTISPVVSNVMVGGGVKRVKRGDAVTINWQSRDNQTISSQTIRLSLDNGQTFPITIATGLSADTASFNWTPGQELSKTKTAVIQIEAVDKAGNKGSSNSSKFRIK